MREDSPLTRAMREATGRLDRRLLGRWMWWGGAAFLGPSLALVWGDFRPAMGLGMAWGLAAGVAFWRRGEPSFRLARVVGGGDEHRETALRERIEASLALRKKGEVRPHLALLEEDLADTLRLSPSLFGRVSSRPSFPSLMALALMGFALALALGVKEEPIDTATALLASPSISSSSDSSSQPSYGEAIPRELREEAGSPGGRGGGEGGAFPDSLAQPQALGDSRGQVQVKVASSSPLKSGEEGSGGESVSPKSDQGGTGKGGEESTPGEADSLASNTASSSLSSSTSSVSAPVNPSSPFLGAKGDFLSWLPSSDRTALEILARGR